MRIRSRYSAIFKRISNVSSLFYTPVDLNSLIVKMNLIPFSSFFFVVGAGTRKDAESGKTKTDSQLSKKVIVRARLVWRGSALRDNMDGFGVWRSCARLFFRSSVRFCHLVLCPCQELEIEFRLQCTTTDTGTVLHSETPR